MKIAIIGPRPVPYCYGGAEKLYDTMVENINKYSRHQCRLITIESKEDNFWNLIETYKKFFDQDLTEYDLVISTKYPTWMVKCKIHYTFLQHMLRGLYDTYELTGLPEKLDSEIKEINDILDIVRGGDLSRTRFTEVQDLLLKHKPLILESGLDSFPGPFIREIIQ